MEAINLTGNLMYIPLRAACRCVDANITCDACGRVESLEHILQVCPKTHASRVARHNKVFRLVATTATRKRWNVFVEPAIPTIADLISYYTSHLNLPSSMTLLLWRITLIYKRRTSESVTITTVAISNKE